MSNIWLGLPWNTLLWNNSAFQLWLWGPQVPKTTCFCHVEQQPTKLISLSREPRKYIYKLNLILLCFRGYNFESSFEKKKGLVGCVITKWCMTPRMEYFHLQFSDSGDRKALIMCLSKRHSVTSKRIIMCKLSFEYENKSVALLQCNTFNTFLFSYDNQHEPDLERHAASCGKNLTSRPPNNQRLEDQWRGAIR